MDKSFEAAIVRMVVYALEIVIILGLIIALVLGIPVLIMELVR